MKRALAVAAVGGILVLSAPGAAFGEAAVPAAGYQTTDHPGDHGSPEPDAESKDGSTEPEATGQPKQAPAHPYGDREQHDDDEDTILF